MLLEIKNIVLKVLTKNLSIIIIFKTVSALLIFTTFRKTFTIEGYEQKLVGLADPSVSRDLIAFNFPKAVLLQNTSKIMNKNYATEFINFYFT